MGWNNPVYSISNTIAKSSYHVIWGFIELDGLIGFSLYVQWVLCEDWLFLQFAKFNVQVYILFWYMYIYYKVLSCSSFPQAIV